MSANFPSSNVNQFFPLSHGNLLTPFSNFVPLKMCVNIVTPYCQLQLHANARKKELC